MKYGKVPLNCVANLKQKIIHRLSALDHDPSDRMRIRSQTSRIFGNTSIATATIDAYLNG